MCRPRNSATKTNTHTNTRTSTKRHLVHDSTFAYTVAPEILHFKLTMLTAKIISRPPQGCSYFVSESLMQVCMQMCTLVMPPADVSSSCFRIRWSCTACWIHGPGRCLNSRSLRSSPVFELSLLPRNHAIKVVTPACMTVYPLGLEGLNQIHS